MLLRARLVAALRLKALKMMYRQARQRQIFPSTTCTFRIPPHRVWRKVRQNLSVRLPQHG